MCIEPIEVPALSLSICLHCACRRAVFRDVAIAQRSPAFREPIGFPVRSRRFCFVSVHACRRNGKAMAIHVMIRGRNVYKQNEDDSVRTRNRFNRARLNPAEFRRLRSAFHPAPKVEAGRWRNRLQSLVGTAPPSFPRFME